MTFTKEIFLLFYYIKIHFQLFPCDLFVVSVYLCPAEEWTREASGREDSVESVEDKNLAELLRSVREGLLWSRPQTRTASGAGQIQLSRLPTVSFPLPRFRPPSTPRASAPGFNLLSLFLLTHLLLRSQSAACFLDWKRIWCWSIKFTEPVAYKARRSSVLHLSSWCLTLWEKRVLYDPETRHGSHPSGGKRLITKKNICCLKDHWNWNFFR